MSKFKKPLIFTGVVAVLGVISFISLRVAVIAASPEPNNLGVNDNGELAPCPETPNCVSSRAADAEHAIDPIVYSSDTAAAHSRLVQVLESMPRLTIEDNQPNYIHAVTTSPMMGFIDDNEFYFDDEAKIIEVRAAARLGQSDLGKNRERIEQIRQDFNAVGP